MKDKTLGFCWRSEKQKKIGYNNELEESFIFIWEKEREIKVFFSKQHNVCVLTFLCSNVHSWGLSKYFINILCTLFVERMIIWFFLVLLLSYTGTLFLSLLRIYSHPFMLALQYSRYSDSWLGKCKCQSTRWFRAQRDWLLSLIQRQWCRCRCRISGPFCSSSCSSYSASVVR